MIFTLAGDIAGAAITIRTSQAFMQATPSRSTPNNYHPKNWSGAGQWAKTGFLSY
jgi:hypothetical protein